jgi:hypothetical protein
MKILQVGAELLYVDGQTAKLLVAIREFAKAPDEINSLKMTTLINSRSII